MANSKRVLFNIINFVALLILSGLVILKTFLSPFYRAFFAAKLPLTLRTPEDCFKGLDKKGYPFKANYVEIPAGGGISLPRMHYVDEGNKDARGCSVSSRWSFLYRHMIPPLVQAGYRVIAPDFIGFGKSDKYTSLDNYTHEMHMASLRQLIDHLDLENITLVCQDWGGLVGLSVVKDMPEKFSSLVIMNTGLPTGDIISDAPNVPIVTALAKGMPFLNWRMFALLLGKHIPVSTVFGTFCGFSSSVVEAYQAPFPDSSFQAGVAKWPLLVPIMRDDAVAPHMVDARRFLKSWKKPALIMFSDKDPITRGQEKMFKKLIGHAKEVRINGAGHFLQETHGTQLAENIVQFKN